MKWFIALFLILSAVLVEAQDSTAAVTPNENLYEFKLIKRGQVYFHCLMNATSGPVFSQSAARLNGEDQYALIKGRKISIRQQKRKGPWDFVEKDSVVATSQYGSFFSYLDAQGRFYQLSDTLLNKVDFKIKYSLEDKVVMTVNCFKKDKRYYMEVLEQSPDLADPDFTRMMALYYGVFVIELRKESNTAAATSTIGLIGRALFMGL